MTKEDVYRFLESAGGAALITILLGSFGASAVTYVFQTLLQRREQQATAYQDTLNRRRATVQQIYGAVGTMVTRTEALIEMMQEDFDQNLYRGPARRSIKEQHERIRREYNQADIEWRSQQMTLTLQVADVLGDTAEELWDRVATTVDEFKRCALNIASEERVIESPDAVCQREKAEIVEQSRDLSRLLSEVMYDP